MNVHIKKLNKFSELIWYVIYFMIIVAMKLQFSELQIKASGAHQPVYWKGIPDESIIQIRTDSAIAMINYHKFSFVRMDFLYSNRIDG